MRHHVRVIAAAGTVLAAAATACSGSSTGSSAAVTAPAATSRSVALEDAAKAAPATVTTKSVPLGKVLVNDKNLTLYLFQADKTSKSTCTGACATAWPPLVVTGKPTASGGVQSKLLSTGKRSDGSAQVTYKGHPLYRFAGDTKPGDVNGQGLNNFGAKWYVLGTDGKQITSTSSSSSSSGGGGY
ncbi:COG4315 family predicted lipoprotein [Streptomyces sp. IBSBF 2435]|uniref:COG4315 family predicted lipoprotein n=1 Tax=Streptomyces sp. IBSBF 2435 TaxID=2903531 RepID=UPI002FDBF5BD